MQKALVNFNIKITEELKEKIKVVAIKKRTTIQDLVTVALEKMVKENEKN